ncbi:hypothetical protein DFA_10333 [Cavenderia fasciculata]|uniref:Uncharacterized protein n=1 Tax=Cavenderia fasciculata TaxID=261658 RepID=F4Q9X4_CACFS|nr:uncharacterized protein DFA_10333 [Cavenderia fasciculata]EGG15493.1 hypothetical protein DFA_10333 [Cavenderia fasciculata]|eukprot:XP_004354235.1 hypothetical protein DFA_10333 [Cavenderia fasciculata]
MLNQLYLRRQIFNHVSSIHKQLEIETVKVSSLYTLVDYIQYGSNDLFFKHIDQLWRMMFTDGRYRNDHSHRLTRILSAAICFNNYRVLEYLLNRIKREISPFQMTIRIDFIDSCHGEDSAEDIYCHGETNIYCLNPKVFNLLIDDSIFIESNRLLNRMVKTAILVFGDVDIIRELFGRYNLSNLIDLFRQYEPIDCGLPTMIKDLFNKKTDTELIQLYNVVTKLNKMIDKETQGNIRMYALVYNRLNLIKHASQGKKKWKPKISPFLFSPYASKNIQENERKKEIIKIDYWDDYSYYYDDQGLMDKINNGADIEYVRYIFSPQTTDMNDSQNINLKMQEQDYFAKALASGSEQVVSFVLDAAMTANINLYKRVYKAVSALNTILASELVRILLLVVNAGHYHFAMKYLDTMPQMVPSYQKSSIEILFNLYFDLVKKDRQSKQEDIDQFQDYQQLANKILDLVPTKKRFEIIYYAKELTDEEFNILWVRFSIESNVEFWLDDPSKDHNNFMYDKNFFNHLQRLYRLYQQDQLDEYQYIKYPMNPPPFDIEYIGIWNQC